MAALLTQTNQATRTISKPFVWIFGVILPLAAILFEAAAAFCVEFIDPMPTPAYVVLLLFVPVGNFLAWLGLKRDALDHARALAAIAGFTAAIALFYTILFLPVLPLAVVGLIAGLPVLAFAPIFAFWTALRLARAWHALSGARPIVLGATAALAAIVALALPAIAIRAGAELAASPSHWLRDTGFWLLGRDGVRDELLRTCRWSASAGARESVALLTGRRQVSRDEARVLYYRLTGQSFESQPVSRWRRSAWMRFDDARGGDRVAGPAEGVTLASSRLDGSVDPVSAVAYFQWTLVFHNSSALQQEARTEIALPPGGIVSRATLWIHGAEREAAFGERAQVRQAYESVVRARRDPLLVTSSGPGRVLVQCFPIQPSGDIKIRLGITAPVSPEGITDRGVVLLPRLLARNFDVAVPAWTWIESKAPLAPAVGKFESRLREDTVHVLRGPVNSLEPAAIGIAGVTWGKVWSPATASKKNGTDVVLQQFVTRTSLPAQPLVLVVDASASTVSIRDVIAASIAAAPPGTVKRVLLATCNGPEEWSPKAPWVGGVDAVPALEEALRAHDGTVLWIAGDQAVRFSGAEGIRQVLERATGDGRLRVLAAGGENIVLRDLDGAPGVEIVPRLGSVGEDLRRTLAQRRKPEQQRVPERRVVPSDSLPGDAQRGSIHIVRLWAAEQSAHMAERDRPGAVALAVAHQIVTSLSGAVVLETAAQYSANSLQPAPTSSVPTMPEPETWALLAVGSAVLVWLAGKRRGQALAR
jgi:hypothetical protein